MSISSLTVIGFEKSVVSTIEENPNVKIKVQFYSGSDDLLFATYDVQFGVQLSSANNATESKYTYMCKYLHPHMYCSTRVSR